MGYARRVAEVSHVSIITYLSKWPERIHSSAGQLFTWCVSIR